MDIRKGQERPLSYLLVGPWDPHCGEYTFLAPPLGVWRLAGMLQSRGIEAEVFDPNCCGANVEEAFERTLRSRPWDVIGISTTGMTLRYDLALSHQARRAVPDAILIAGGMEATFRPDRVFELGPPFDLVGLGEGEKALLEIAHRLQQGGDLAGIPGTALRTHAGEVARFHRTAMTREELSHAIAATPYKRMPYERYWQRLETAYGVGTLPYKAEREARLAEVRAVRLITLNYCPMGCSFCSSTNFLHEAQEGSPASPVSMPRMHGDDPPYRGDAPRSAHDLLPGRHLRLHKGPTRVAAVAIVAAKERGGSTRSPVHQHQSHRCDELGKAEGAAARGFSSAGVRIENFSRSVLQEFNKRQIHRHIEPMLSTALRLGITPFLDLILTSPRSTMLDLTHNVSQAMQWIAAGCEVGIYPYIIPFSGASITRDPELQGATCMTRTIPGTR